MTTSKVLFALATVCLVILSALGLSCLNRPLPRVEPPPFVNSSDYPFPDTQIPKARVEKWNKEVIVGRFNDIPLTSATFPYRQSYRLILMPSFDAPILIQASRTSEGFELTTKLLSGIGGYGKEMGKLASSETRPMTDSEWQHLTELLLDASFWSMPSIDRGDVPLVDGASWLVEGRSEDSVHSVIREDPQGKFLEACTYFLQLANRGDDYKGYFDWLDK